MPFVSKKDARELTQGLTPYQDTFTPEFSEVFAASVGQVFDEELSISNALNREGFRNRHELVKSVLESRGDLDRSDYIDRRGRFDFDRFAEDSKDERIKTNAQLNEERNEYLELKRNYANSVKERGNGMAQFLGMATGYILDPINAATMGTGSSVNAARATTTIGKSMLMARDAAVIGAATELAIQPLVYEHKSSIESPYAFEDALEAIVGATIGGAAIGAVSGGISGYIRSVRKAADDLPKTKDIEYATESLIASEQTLKNAPDKTVEGEVDFLRQLEQQRRINDAPSKTTQQYDVPDEVIGDPGYTVINEVSIGDDFTEPGLAVGRQSELLDNFGIKDDFDRDMIAFSQIESPKTVIDGEIVDASDIMRSLDDELEGINSLLVCARG